MALGAGVGAQLREILAGAWRVARIELHGEVAHVGAEVHLLASHGGRTTVAHVDALPPGLVGLVISRPPAIDR